MKKKTLLGIGISTAILAAILLAANIFMLNFSLSPKHEGKDLEGSWNYMFENYPELKTWKDSLDQTNALKDTFIQNSRNCTWIYRQCYPHDDDWLFV